MQTVVKRPFITEKTLALASYGLYTFEVAKDAGKAEIADDIAKLYNVHVTEVRTISMRGKTRRVGRKMSRVKKSDWKKALVRLAAGQKIDAFEVTTKEEAGKT